MTHAARAAHSRRIQIYTDGACRGNPGPGGWGVVLRMQGVDRELCGCEAHTTSNRMELMAAIQVLSLLESGAVADVFTDSEYVLKGLTEWLPGWKRRGGRNAHNKPVANRDLWERLEAEAVRHVLRWHWVKGHSGHVENERADALANLAIDELSSKVGTP